MHTMKKTLLAGAAFAALSLGMPTASHAGYDVNSRIDALEAQIRDLKAQMNARDARLAELEAADRADLSGLPKFDPKKLAIESRDGQFAMSIGGRVQLDGAIFNGDEGVGIADTRGAEIRRARLYVQGKMFGVWKYKAQGDFGGGSFEPVDVYLERDFGNASWRIGHYNPYVSLEDQTSNKYITFMERSMMNDIVGPGQTLGTGVKYSDGKFWGAAAGAFLNAGEDGDTWGFATFDSGTDNNANYNFNGRVWAAPINNDEMNLHVGLGGAWYRLANDSDLRFRARPMTHMAARIVDTGAITGGNDFYTITPEVAFRYGPFNLEAEYSFIQANGTDLNGTGNDEADYDAWYVQGSYFINGHRSYDVEDGAYGRPKVQPGAIQLAALYGQTNLDDAANSSSLSGDAWNITGGINYYFNKYMLVKFNYVYAKADYANGSEGDFNTYQMRWQYDF